MNKRIISILIILAIFIGSGVLMFGQNYNTNHDICLIYINGILNTQNDAMDGLMALQRAVEDVVWEKGRDVTLTYLIHNQSKNGLRDFSEAAWLKWIDNYKSMNDSARFDLDQLDQAVNSASSNCRRTLLVGHSEGNLFIWHLLQHYYDKHRENISPNKVGILSLASPTLTIDFDNIQYVMNKKDPILISVQRTWNRIPNSKKLMFSSNLGNGHSLKDVYLNRNGGLSTVKKAIEKLVDY